MRQILVRTLIAKGKAHELRCEDDLYVYEDENYIFTSVFDGCSSGIDSHFASTMFKKIISNLVPDFLAENIELTTANILSKLVLEFRLELKKIMDMLNVNMFNEMLSTLCLCLYDKMNSVCSVIICGDGVCAIDGNIYTKHDENGESVYYITSVDGFDEQELKENTLSYLVNEAFSLVNIPVNKTVSISTDGIDSFVSLYGFKSSDEPRELFLNSELYVNNRIMLKRIYNILSSREEKVINIDDIAVARIIIKDSEDKLKENKEEVEKETVNANKP